MCNMLIATLRTCSVSDYQLYLSLQYSIQEIITEHKTDIDCDMWLEYFHLISDHGGHI